MNYGDHSQQQQQQYMMPQGQRMQNPRMVNVPTNMPPNMQRQQRYAMPLMQPGQQPMQLPPGGQYVQSQQMAPRGQSLNELLSRLPPDVAQAAQHHIANEQNPEMKRRIALNFLQSNQMRMPMYTQGPQGPQGMMVGMNATPKMAMSPATMARVGVPQNVTMSQNVVFHSQSPPLQSNMASVAPGQVPIQRPPGHSFMPGGMQQMQNFQVAQDQSTPAAAIPNYNSPQPSTIQQPSSVGPMVQPTTSLQQKGPSSVPSYAQGHPQDATAPSQAAQGREEEKVSGTDKALYDKKLEELKVYHEQIKRLKERQTIDGVAPKPVYERLLELIEGRRAVPMELLNKLYDRIQTLIEQSSPMFTLTELFKNMPSDISTAPALPDPWADLRQYSIGGFESFSKDDDFPLKDTTVMKRTASPIEGQAIKRIKRESQSVTAPQIKMEYTEDGPINPQREEYCFDETGNERNFDIKEECLAVTCRNGTRLDLPGRVALQLRNTRYRLDPDLAPISNECTEVQLLIENDILLVPPLRIIVPVDYPKRGASVWRDPALANDTTLNELFIQFDKRLTTTSDSSSIPQILHAWKVASEHVFKASYPARRNSRR